MVRRVVVASVLVFVLWLVLDYVLHSLLLMGLYQATQALWRPVEDMKQGVMLLSLITRAFAFVLVYRGFVGGRDWGTILGYALLWGVAAGAGMAGSYAWSPIPGTLAWAWFAGTVVEFLAAGGVLGLVFLSRTSHP